MTPQPMTYEDWLDETGEERSRDTYSEYRKYVKREALGKED